MSTIIHRWLLFFFNDTATTEIYTLSLHDALPISVPDRIAHQRGQRGGGEDERQAQPTVSGQGAAGQKERHGRERQPDLLGEHPTEDDQVAVPDENVDDSVHYAPAGYQVDPIPGSPTIAAPRGAQEKFSLTAFGMRNGRVPSVPRRCRLSGARWRGDAGMATFASKNHGLRRDRPSCSHHGCSKTRV